MTFAPTLTRTERTLLLLGFATIVIFGMKEGASIVNIVLVSLILTLLLYPATRWLRERGLPTVGAVGIVTVVACLVILLVLFLVVKSFDMILTDLPQYQAELAERLAGLTAFFGAHGIDVTQMTSQIPGLVTVVPQIFSSLLNVGAALMDLFFIAVTTIFMLLEAPAFIGRVESLLKDSPEKLRQLSRMSGYIIDFIVVRTETNLVHGVLFGGSLALMGVHGAILWGTLTFLLGYIPYIGLIIAAIPALFFAWLQFGMWGVVAVVVVVCILNLIVENPVFSWLAARKFEIPALVVILSVIFWGWLLGLAGMLFSVPFTLLVCILFHFSDDLRWLNTILGVGHLFEEKNGDPPGPDKNPLKPPNLPDK